MTSQTGQIRGFFWEICRQKEWAVDRKQRDVSHGISSPLTHLDLVPFRVQSPHCENLLPRFWEAKPRNYNVLILVCRPEHFNSVILLKQFWNFNWFTQSLLGLGKTRVSSGIFGRGKEWSVGRKQRYFRHWISSPLTHLYLVSLRFQNPWCGNLLPRFWEAKPCN